MNQIKCINTDYLRPSRTIETIEISNNENIEINYIYNYEGTHFRLFKNVLEIIKFFGFHDFEPKISFRNESTMDNYLLEMVI